MPQTSHTYYVLDRDTHPLESWATEKEELEHWRAKDFERVAEDYVMEEFEAEADDRDRFTVIVASNADGSDARQYIVEIRRGDSWTELCDGSGDKVTIPLPPVEPPPPDLVTTCAATAIPAIGVDPCQNSQSCN